jgi:hypothetical protein
MSDRITYWLDHEAWIPWDVNGAFAWFCIYPFVVGAVLVQLCVWMPLKYGTIWWLERYRAEWLYELRVEIAERRGDSVPDYLGVEAKREGAERMERLALRYRDAEDRLDAAPPRKRMKAAHEFARASRDLEEAIARGG